MVAATSANDGIAIVQKVPGRLVLRKRVAELLRNPGRGGMVGDRHVDEPPPVVREDDEHEQQPEGDVGTTNRSAARI